MPFYPTAGALLSDARLRWQALGSGLGILVVEGPDDKRLIAPHLRRREQIIPAGGRILLLSAHRAMEGEDQERIVFLTDCDYEVTLGKLAPAPGLVITENADVEADLIALGLLERLVSEYVPGALESDEMLSRVGADVLAVAYSIAEPIGRVRYIAKQGGFSVDLKDMRLHRIVGSDQQLDLRRLAEVITARSQDCPLNADELLSALASTPTGFRMCNGHDLCYAIAFVFKQYYGVTAMEATVVERSLRLALNSEDLGRWDVANRLVRWQADTRLALFR